MATLKIPISDQDHIQGNVKAACTLVEYGDYECPNCGAAYPLVKQIQQHFGPRIQFVFRNFPMTRMHPNAQTAAEVAEFAAIKGQFWKMHDLLYENQHQLGEALYAKLAATLKFDTAELQKALAEKTFSSRVSADFSGGVRSGVNGTPTFYINSQRYDAPMDYDSMVGAIETALAP
jgi:protein-disulfide isomerase